MAELKGYKFRIYRSTSSSGPYTKIAEITGNTFEYDDENVVAGQIYYYCLATVDTETGLESSWTLPVSCVASGQLPPSVPSGLTVTDNNGLVALDWQDSQAGDNLVSYYNVWRSLNGTDYNIIATTSESQYVDFAVTPGQTYYYYISAVDTEGLESDHCAPVSTTIAGVIISAPTDLQGLSGADAVKLTWDEVTGASKYRVFQNNVLIGETTENYFIYITTYHGTATYTVRAVNNFNQESEDSNSVQVASTAPSATITFPSSSPYNSSSPTIIVKGTSQEDFSIEYVELEVVSGSETHYTKAAGAKNWQCPLTLENASYTIRARAKSIAGNVSSWTSAITINVDAPATVYKYANGSWVALSQASNVKVHQELNKAATASFTLPTKELEMKDRVSIRGSGVSFIGRVLTRNNTESDFWNYTCVDESYALQRIVVDILEDKSWTVQGKVNDILKKLFSILASEGYVNFGIEASSVYNYEVDPDTLKGKTVWGILEQLSSITSDVFYFDSKLGKLVFKPKTPASSSLELVYGENISGWKYEEHRENIINITDIRGKISDKELPIKDITKNYLLGLYPAEKWNYDLYWQTLKKVGSMGSYAPYGTAFKIYSDLYTQEYTTGFIGIRIPLPSVPKSTINFAVPVTKKGSPPDLKVYIFQVPSSGTGGPQTPDIRYPTKEFTFASSSFTANTEKIITFSMDIDASNSSTPNWLIIYFALPSNAEIGDRDYYMLRWVTGGWGITEGMISMFSINRESTGRPIVPVVGGIINFSNEIEYWTATSDSAYRYPYEESQIVLLGGKSLERSDLNYAFEEYWGILARFAGEFLLELYYGDSVVKNYITSNRAASPGDPSNFAGEALEYDEINSYMLLFTNSFADYVESGVSAEGWTYLFLKQSPPTGAKLTKIKIIALSPYVHLTDFKLIGKTGLEVKKKITDIDPTSTSIDDYGLCPDPDSGKEREFSSKDEMNEYVNNLLLTNSKPLVSLTITYPYVTVPSLPSTMSLSIPEIQENPFTLKVIGCDWDLDNRTTDLIFEAAPLNYLVQALKSLQNKVGG